MDGAFRYAAYQVDRIRARNKLSRPRSIRGAIRRAPITPPRWDAIAQKRYIIAYSPIDCGIGANDHEFLYRNPPAIPENDRRMAEG